MAELGTNMEESMGYGVSRRRVLQGAAWSVPAVMLTRVPAIGSNGTEDLTIDFGNSTSCKIPGESWKELCYTKGYVLWAVVQNNTGQPIAVTGVAAMSVGGVPQTVVAFTEPAVACSVPVDCVDIPPNGEKIIGIFSNASTDSSSTLVEVTLRYQFATCDTAVDDSLLSENEGYVTGSPWPNTQGGSCDFPPGCEAPRTPPTAC